MHIHTMISTIDTHTAGEPTRIVTGGIPHIPGKTMMEKKIWMQDHLDHVRKMLMLEPRGHKDMFGAVITSPCCNDAHAGVIFMDSKGYLDMCGHGSIGAVTVLLNTGMVTLQDLSENINQNNSRQIILDTPAGTITACAAIENGAATEVSIRNVPSFYYDTLYIDLPSVGRINVDIAYGGNFFALVNVKELKMELEVENIDRLTSAGLEIRNLVNDAITVIHPATGAKCQVPLTEIYQENYRDHAYPDHDHALMGTTKNESRMIANSSKNFHIKSFNKRASCRNIVVFGNGQIDRSPCGTGTCAKMAYLYEKGKLGIGEPYLHSSIINTVFTGTILEEAVVGNKRAILPQITGRAHITGFHSFIAETDDPFKEGFSL
ncbi:MAG: proline racemase family protein [Desulfamplus sp.]|nr:proline racemase family protein [Desulfamplus sp.]